MICGTNVFVIDGDYKAFVYFEGDPYRDLHVLDNIQIDGRELIVVSKSETAGGSHDVYFVMITARRNGSSYTE